MVLEQFLKKFAKILEIEPQALTENLVLPHLPTWDSLSFLAIISLVNQYFAVAIEGCALSRCQNLTDVFKLIKIDFSIPAAQQMFQ